MVLGNEMLFELALLVLILPLKMLHPALPWMRLSLVLNRMNGSFSMSLGKLLPFNFTICQLPSRSLTCTAFFDDEQDEKPMVAIVTIKPR
jgi:hypothetical protein